MESEELIKALESIDQDKNGYVTFAELIHIPVIRLAIALNEPGLLTPYNLNGMFCSYLALLFFIDQELSIVFFSKVGLNIIRNLIFKMCNFQIIINKRDQKEIILRD